MFEKALDISKNHIPSLYHLGLMQHKDGKYKDALTSFTEVLSLVGPDRLVDIFFSNKQYF